MMGQDIALCALLETLARVQLTIAKALAEDIRSKAAQLQHSSTVLAAEVTKRAVAYAEIIERIVRGENLGTQNAELIALRGLFHRWQQAIQMLLDGKAVDAPEVDSRKAFGATLA